MPQATPKRAGREPKPGSRFPAEVAAANVRDYRKLRGLSQEELGQRMARLGHAWTASIVGFVERADRNLTIDEYLGVALILAVPPGYLLNPWGVDGHGATGLDVGLDEPLSHGEAFVWLDQAVTAEVALDGRTLDVRYLPNLRSADQEEIDREHLAVTLNESRARRRPARKGKR